MSRRCRPNSRRASAPPTTRSSTASPRHSRAHKSIDLALHLPSTEEACPCPCLFNPGKRKFCKGAARHRADAWLNCWAKNLKTKTQSQAPASNNSNLLRLLSDLHLRFSKASLARSSLHTLWLGFSSKFIFQRTCFERRKAYLSVK